MDQIDLSHGGASVRRQVLDQQTVAKGRAAIHGERKGFRALLPFLGPAFVASVAYVDPGNYATNIQSGAEFGYKLLWVVVLASIMAMLFQNLSAKLGIATGKNLAEMCREHFPKSACIVLWVLSEIAAMATDLAEFLGATLGLNFLFHIPMTVAVVLTGAATYIILMLDRFGFRPLEKFIGAFVLLIGICYLLETILSRPALGEIAYHSVVPWIGGHDSILLGVGIIGATIMPHAVYLHSSLTQNRIVPRSEEEAIEIQRFNTKEVVMAMSLAGFVNMAMMFMAASVFHGTGHSHVGDITSAYQTLTPLLGSASAAVFLVSLLASGFSSSAVGTMAGQVIMQGFVGFTIPIWLRRVITMIPTVIIIALGVDPTETLVISQVVLSMVLPIPIVALIIFTKRKDIMGVLANKPAVNAIAISSATLIVCMNLLLLCKTL